MPHKDPAARRAYDLAHRERINALRKKRYPQERQRKLAAAHRSRLKRAYGITPEEFAAMHQAQGGGCALCGHVPKSRRLCIDHDHVTGRVRGLLCIQCNSALGTLGDTVGGLARAIDYLQGRPRRVSVLDLLEP